MSETTSTPAEAITPAVAVTPEVSAPVAPAMSIDTAAIDAALQTAVASAVASEKAHTAELEAELAAAEEKLTAATKSATPTVTPVPATPDPATTVAVTNTSGFPLIASRPDIAPHNIVFRRGSTPDVPEAFWTEWATRNADLDVVKNGLISAK